MGVLVTLVVLFLVLLVLSWIIAIPIALLALAIKLAPFLILAAIIYGLVTGRIEITFHRDRRR